MPIFEYEGKKYNVKEEHIENFINDFPNATTILERDGKKYRVKSSDYSSFLSEHITKPTKEDIPTSNFTGKEQTVATNPVDEVKSDTLRTDDEYFGNQAFSPKAMRNRMKKIENVAKETKSSLDNKSKELSEELDNLSLSSPIATGHTKDNGLQFNPSTGKLERTFSTPYGNTTTNKQIADLESYEYRTANNMTVSGRMRNANIRLEKLKAQAEERQRKVVEEWEQKQSEEYQEAQDKGFLGILQHSMRNTNNPSNTPRTWIEGDPEYRALQAAIHETEEEIATIKRESDRQDGKRVGFWRGFGEITGDIRTWDFGIGNLLDNGAKLSIDNELAEQYKSDGTRQAEQELLEAAYLNQQAQQEYGANDSFWFRAGTMTGHMPSFMLDFALTGGGFDGINILSKAATKGATKVIGKEVVEKMAKEGFKSYVKKNGIKGFGQEAANWTIKALGTTADDLIIRAPLMTNTVAVAKTASDIADRKLGNVVINEDGTYDFSNDRTWSSAIWQGEANAIIENFSEMFGTHLPSIKPADMAKLAEVMGAKRLSNILAKANTASLTTIQESLRKMGVSDYLGEVTEEYYGQLWRTMLNLDDAYIHNPDGTRTNLLATGRFHGDVWGGMALSMGLMGAGKYSLSAANYAMMKHDVNKADSRARELFSDDIWEPLRHTIDLTTNDDIGDYIANVLADDKFTAEEKEAVLNYTERSLYLRGFNLATLAQSRNTDETDNDIIAQQNNESYLDGYNASDPQEMNDVRNTLDIAKEKMVRIFGLADESDIDDFLGEDPIMTVAVRRRNGEDEESSQAILDYLNAKATYDGMIQRIRNDIDGQIEQSNALIDSHTNKRTGMIHGAVSKENGKLVYIVSGNVVAYDDGTGIDLQKSDESIIIRDAETGELQQVSPEFLSSLYDTQDPNEQKEFNAQQLREQIAQEEGNKIDGTVDFNNKEQFLNDAANQIAITMILAEKGFDSEYIKTFLGNAQIVENPDGTLTFTDGQNQVVVPKLEIQQQVDANAKQRAIEFDNKKEEIRKRLTETDVTSEQQNTSPASLIPKDEHGNPIYEQADPSTAWDALVEEAEGDEEIVTSVVQSMIADKKKELSKLEKAKVKDGTTPAEKTAAHKAHKIAVELARQEVEAWKNIANAPILRKQAEMAERQRIEDEKAAQRKAEEERIKSEQEEAARIEREMLNGIPDIIDDTPQDARARGYRRINGHLIERQQPIQIIQGKETEVEFSNSTRPKGHYALIESSQLQPSHIHGNRNPLHFLDEAQPKERNDEASIVSTQKIAGNIRPATITTGETAYVGTPTVNTRGEVIQGNSRSDALKLMYENHQDQTQVYKQHLIDNAEQFGLNPEDVSNMENPVLVRMLDVNDEQAIMLGQYVAQDTESGGIERIKPKNTVKKMGNDIGTYANLLLNGNNEDMSFAELLDNNGVEVLKWMAQKGYITPTQYDSQFDTKGNLTAEAKNDLRGIMYQSIFEGGNTRLEEMFNALPAKAQKAILATAHRDFNSPNSERMMEEIQDSIRAFHALMQDEQFANAKDFKSALMAVEAWQRQYQMDDVSGESYLPSEKFSNFALHLATMYKGEKQSNIQGVFNELYDLIQGAKEDNLFEQADNTPRTLVQAIKEVLNIDYNGQRRNNVLVGDNKTSQQGQHRRSGNVASEKRTENGERHANDSGRTDEDSGSSTFEIYRQAENESGDLRTAQTVHQSRSERKRPEQTPDGRRKTDGTGVADDATQEVLGASNRGDLRVFEEGLDTSYRAYSDDSERTRRAAESERLVSLAKQHGLFIPVEVIKTLTGKVRKRTGESVVYIDKEAGKVTKVKDPYAKSAMKSGVQPEDAAFEHLVHNLLFPETAYSLEAISEEMGDVRIVLTQNYIQNYDQPTREQIAEALAARGLFPEDNYSFGNELVSVTDVEGDNVLLGEDGTVYFIDPIIRFKKPLREILAALGGAEQKAPTIGEQIQAAEAEVNTNPTEAQKEAGNYKKGHVQIGTFNVTIEQPKGSVRSGVDANGKKWETTMHNTYGYIRGTEGVDGDHIDVFLSNDIDGWNGNKIFVVDQYNEDGTFDEHKVMLGFNDIEEAESAYLDNYEKGWEKKHKIVVSPIHTEEFEKWINSSHRKTKAFAEYKSVQSTENRTKNNENRTKSTENSSKVEENSVKDESKNKTIVEQSKKPSSKIEDFGEKIGGARKDVIRKYADKINVNGTTFGSMFPKPDIDKLIEAGLPIDRVAALKAVYDNAKHEFERSKKHRGKERALRETVFYAVFAKGILSGNEDFELHHEGLVFTEVGVKIVKANIALYQAVFDRLGVEYIKTDLSAYAITPLTEETKKKLNLKSLNEHNGKMQESLAKRKGTEPPVYKDGDLINFIGEKYYNPKDQFETLEEAIDTMVERIGKEVKVGEEIKHTPILYWNVDALGRKDYSKIFIGIKVHGHGIVKLMEFKSSNEANSWIDEHDADFQQMAAAKIEQLKSDKSKPLPKYRIDNIYVRDNNGSIVRYDVYADFGKGIMRPLKSFDIPSKETSQKRLRAQSEVYKNEVLPYMNSEEAKQSADEHARRIQQEKESKNRNYTTERKSRERVGRDWRNGKDATPDMFVDMDGNKSVFGFRAVEFGNYVTNKERQQFLNDIYDALMDMSDVLGVSPRALSLGGQLGIAVGARGKSSASGHYEPEKNVINLTKTSGYGILAHEWLHAFDRYFSSYNPSAIYVGGVQYATSEEYKDDMRQEVKDAFAALMDVIKKSDYYKRSMMLGEYWSSDKELAARALQDHIIRKLNERGQKNEFLSNLTATEDWDGEAENYPFPLGEESERIGEAIDNLFSVIDEKVDEKGNTVMYQKGELVMDAESEAFRRATERTMKQLESIGIDVEIVSDEQTEAMLGNDVKFMSERRFSMLKKAASTINRWLSDNVRGKSFELHLPEHTRKLIKKAMGRDFDSHNITSNGIAHALKNHGETGTKLNERSIPIRKEDAELIPYIMTAPDRVEKAATDISGRESIRFYKELSNGYVVVVEKEYKNSPDDMETITMWAEKSSKATNAQQNAAPDTHVQNAILSTDVAKIQKDAETAILNDEKINFSRSAGIFYSNAKKAVLDIKQDKATPEQWLKMIEKNGGLKASEDRWLGLSDWLKTQQKRKNIDVQYAKEYDGEAKQIAHGIKEGDNSSIDLAAIEMAKLVKDGDILIPIPSRTGKATTSLALANRIAELAGKGKVADVLTGKERESLYNIKKEGKELPKASELEFVLKNQDVLNGNNRVVFVDNVMGTGTTLEAAVELIPNATALVYAKDNSTLSDKKTLTKDEILNFINENSIQIEEVEYEENPSSFDELKDEYERLLREEGYDYAQEVMRDRYGNDFDIAFADMGGELVIDNEETAATLLGSNNIINSTRLQYTTEGLDNKKEIALVVPTVEPYNSHDDIHFGDAGNGRAVAWVRFGETTDKGGKRVLVIDEIQSKRHQDGREKGYGIDKKRGDFLKARQEQIVSGLKELGVTTEVFENDTYRFVDDTDGEQFGTFTKIVPNDERGELIGQYARIAEELWELKRNSIPSAPFEKNWHELAMKRMLRYAAENGFDKVAWTTGEQQAERYNISSSIESISSKDNNIEEFSDGTTVSKNFALTTSTGMVINIMCDSEGIAHGGDYNGKHLSEIVGKELAEKMMQPGDFTLSDEGLKLGGEGMKGFYDNMLPAFVNKYGKKWGAKVGEVSLPKIGDDGLTMHSVDVTPQMKEDVMKGQPMFHKGQMSFDFLNQQDTPLSDTRLRKLEEGETSKIERIFTENKNFDFTSGEKIESIDDVAFIFKQLEDESIENSFAVLVKDGKPTIIHLGMGSYTATGLNGSALNVAVERIQPDKIYFIHNHPSGNLTASRQDIELLNRLKSTYGDIFEDGIIINLRSGKFATFNAEEKNIHDEKNIDNAVPVKVYSFNKQVFEKNYDPAETFKIRSSSDVAKFISSHRLGERPKLGILVCNNQLGVVGNVFTPYTKVTKENAKDIAKDIVYYTTSMGGTCAMMFGNANIYEVGSKRISQHVEDISTGSIKLMDYLNMQKDGSYWSASDEGVSFMRTSSGTIYGWSVDGKVYLTKDGINPNTPVHEYTHLWAAAMANSRPKRWNRIVEGLKGSHVWNEVLLDSEYKDIHGNDNLMASEVLSRHSGTENYRRTMEEAQREIESEKGIFAKAEKVTIWERVKQALKDFWNWVGLRFTRKPIAPEQSTELVLADFWNGIRPDVNDNPMQRMFVGEKGAANIDKAEEATARLDNLSVARKMEAEGKDTKNIKLATGWERGSDGKWRYEVMDNFRFDKSGNVDFEKRNPEYRRYKELIRKNNSLAFEGKELSAEESAEFDKLSATWKGTKLHNSRRLKDYIDAPELFEAYPELKDVDVKFAVLEDGVQGKYNHKQKTVTLNAMLGKEAAASTLNHEIQHAIQHIEGFAKGGNSNDVITRKQEFKSEVRNLHEMMLDTPEWAEYVRLVDRWIDNEDASVEARIEARIEAISNSGVLDGIRSEQDRLRRKYGNNTIVGRILNGPYAEDADIWNELPESFNDRFDAYRRLAGEVESRNVQRRMEMNEEERRSSLAQETEDVAREDQVFLHGALGNAEEDDVLYRYEDTKDKIEELFYQSISGNLKGKPIPIGRLTNNGKVYLEQISGISFKENVDFVLNPSDLIHIYKGHFGNNETDERSIPLDIEDIRSIVDVISFPDKIIYTKEVSGERRKMFFFLKEAENGTYNLLEIYADKKGNLTAKTFYKTKEGVSQRAMTLSKSLHTTSKTDGATLSSANIPQMFESSTLESENLRNNNNESSSSPTRAQRKQMIEHVEDLAKRLHLDNIEIVNSVSGLEGKKKGFFSKKSGKITIVVPNHTSIADIEKTLLHEAVAHYGLRKLFGKHFDTFLDNVYNNVEESIRKHIAELAIKKYNYDFRKATEEYLASLAESINFENARKSSWWQKIKDFFADMLSKLGFKDFRGVTLTDNELRYILWRSYENLSSNKHNGIFGEAADIAKQYELGTGEFENNIEIVNREFNKELSKLTMDNAREKILNLGLPSDTLLSCGIEYKPIRLYGAKLLSKIRKHGYNISDIKNLPKSINRPIAVFEGSQDGSFAILTELNINGNNVLASISVGKGGHDVDFNIISSVYGKKNNSIIKWINEGKLLYADKNKTLDYLSVSAPIAEAQDNQELYLAANIIQNFENPTLDDDILFRDGDYKDAKDEYNHKVRVPNDNGVEKHHNFFRRIFEAYLDSMKALDILQKAILRETGNKMQGFENAYMAENAMSSANHGQKQMFKRDFVKPMMDAVKAIIKKGEKYSEIVKYLISKHGLERNEKFSRRDAEKDGGVWDGTIKDYSGLTAITGDKKNFTDKAIKIVEEFEKKHGNEVKVLWEKINAATKETLRKEFKSGLIDKETYDEICSMFDFYIPLRGWDCDVAKTEYEYLAYNNRMLLSPAVKKAWGRKSLADDPLATIGYMGESAIIRGNRNLMKQRFFNFVLKNPTSLVTVSEQWYVLDNATGTWLPSNPVIPENATPEEIAQIIKDHEDGMTSLGKGKATKKRKGLNLGMHISKFEGQEHVVKVMRNGKEYSLYINGSPRAAQALNGLTNPDIDKSWFYDFCHRLKNWMARNFTSRNPAFVLLNLFRDTQHAGDAVRIKESREYVKRYKKNMRNAYFTKKGWLMGLVTKFNHGTLDMNNEVERYFAEFVKYGGETGYTNISTVEDYKKDIKKFVKEAEAENVIKKVLYGIRDGWDFIWNGIEYLNRCAENTTRFTVYMTSRQMGKDIATSVYDAKEITVNFNKKGSGGFGAKELNFAYVFFNATLQSSNNFVKLFAHAPKRAIGRLVFKYAVTGMVLPAINIALQYLFSGDDDDDNFNYFDVPEWIRRNNIVIMPPNGKGYFTIPLPHIMRAFYGMGEIALSCLMGEMDVTDGIKEAALGLTDLLPMDFTGNGGDLITNLTPTIKQPVEQVRRNENYFGIPIYRDTPWNENDPEHTKAYKGTSPLLVNATRWLNSIGLEEGKEHTDTDIGAINLNPAVIEHFIESYTGGLGTTINKLAKTFAMIWDEDMRNWNNAVILSSFYHELDERSGNKTDNLYWDAVDEMKETERRKRAYNKKLNMGAMEFAEIMDNLMKSPTYQRYTVIKTYSQIVSDFEKAFENVDKSDREDVDEAILKLKTDMFERLEEFDDDTMYDERFIKSLESEMKRLKKQKDKELNYLRKRA